MRTNSDNLAFSDLIWLCLAVWRQIVLIRSPSTPNLILQIDSYLSDWKFKIKSIPSIFVKFLISDGFTNIDDIKGTNYLGQQLCWFIFSFFNYEIKINNFLYKSSNEFSLKIEILIFSCVQATSERSGRSGCKVSFIFDPI